MEASVERAPPRSPPTGSLRRGPADGGSSFSWGVKTGRSMRSFNARLLPPDGTSSPTRTLSSSISASPSIRRVDLVASDSGRVLLNLSRAGGDLPRRSPSPARMGPPAASSGRTTPESGSKGAVRRSPAPSRRNLLLRVDEEGHVNLELRRDSSMRAPERRPSRKTSSMSKTPSPPRTPPSSLSVPRTPPRTSQSAGQASKRPSMRRVDMTAGPDGTVSVRMMRVAEPQTAPPAMSKQLSRRSSVRDSLATLKEKEAKLASMMERVASFRTPPPDGPPAGLGVASRGRSQSMADVHDARAASAAEGQEPAGPSGQAPRASSSVRSLGAMGSLRSVGRTPQTNAVSASPVPPTYSYTLPSTPPEPRPASRGGCIRTPPSRFQAESVPRSPPESLLRGPSLRAVTLMEDADGHVRVVLERVPSPRPRDLDDDATLQSEEPAFVSHEHVAPTEPTIAEGSEEGAASDAASQAGAGSGRGDGTAGEASLADVIGTGAGAAPEQPLGSLSRQESPVRLDPGVDVGMGPASSSLSEGAWGSVEGFEDRGSGSGDSGAEVGVEVGARGPLARTWTEEQRDAMALLQRVAKSAVQNMEGESDDEGDEGRRGEDQAGEGTEQAPATAPAAAVAPLPPSRIPAAPASTMAVQGPGGKVMGTPFPEGSPLARACSPQLFPLPPATRHLLDLEASLRALEAAAAAAGGKTTLPPIERSASPEAVPQRAPLPKRKAASWHFAAPLALSPAAAATSAAPPGTQQLSRDLEAAVRASREAAEAERRRRRETAKPATWHFANPILASRNAAVSCPAPLRVSAEVSPPRRADAPSMPAGTGAQPPWVPHPPAPVPHPLSAGTARRRREHARPLDPATYVRRRVTPLGSQPLSHTIAAESVGRRLRWVNRVQELEGMGMGDPTVYGGDMANSPGAGYGDDGGWGAAEAARDEGQWSSEGGVEAGVPPGEERDTLGWPGQGGLGTIAEVGSAEWGDDAERGGRGAGCVPVPEPQPLSLPFLPENRRGRKGEARGRTEAEGLVPFERLTHEARARRQRTREAARVEVDEGTWKHDPDLERERDRIRFLKQQLEDVRDKSSKRTVRAAGQGVPASRQQPAFVAATRSARTTDHDGPRPLAATVVATAHDAAPLDAADPRPPFRAASRHSRPSDVDPSTLLVAGPRSGRSEGAGSRRGSAGGQRDGWADGREAAAVRPARHPKDDWRRGEEWGARGELDAEARALLATFTTSSGRAL